MSGLLRPVLDHWRLFALAAAAAMLGAAHAFESFGGLPPCTLCLRQREAYWWAGGLAAAFMLAVRLRNTRLVREASCWILGLVFLIGAGLAVYHAGAEWKFWPGPQACASGGASTVDAAAMSELLKGSRIKPPACDEALWVFAGLSMAGWNALISLALAALSVAAALRERSRP